MASTYLTKANPTGGDRTKGTISVWVKRSSLSGTQWIYNEYADGNHFSGVRFNSTNKLGVFSYDSGSAQIDINTTRVFRDTNSWYHIVVAWDTTQGTASDRVKIYINGVRETVFDGSPTYPSSSQGTYFAKGGAGYPINIGRRPSTEYFDGSMSHFHRVDGQALAQTVFGSTDSTTGEWKINTTPSITYTGSSSFNFFILKDGNSVTDQSGQSNNLTGGGGTLTKTEDNPSNVFATINPLVNKTTTGNQTYSNGNTTIDFPAGGDGYMYSTLAFSSGKFYAEFKINSFTADRSHAVVLYTDITSTGLYLSFCKTGNANVITSFGSAVQTGLASFSGGDIIGMAVDATNGTVDFTKNGSAYGSQVTGLSSNFSGKDLFFGFLGEGHPSETRVFNASANFGNGYFGTTAVSSAGTNASGNGIFEHDVPANYTALSTKGLNL